MPPNPARPDRAAEAYLVAVLTHETRYHPQQVAAARARLLEAARAQSVLPPPRPLAHRLARWWRALRQTWALGPQPLIGGRIPSSLMQRPVGMTHRYDLDSYLGFRLLGLRT